jgi:hypothetical protein
MNDEASLDVEINHLKKTLRRNGCRNHGFMRALALKEMSQTQNKKPVGVAMIPYQQTVSNISEGFSASTALRHYRYLRSKASICSEP